MISYTRIHIVHCTMDIQLKCHLLHFPGQTVADIKMNYGYPDKMQDNEIRKLVLQCLGLC